MANTYHLRDESSEDAVASNEMLSGLINEWLTSGGPSAIFRTCENCEHMQQEGPAFCKLYQMTPPVAVIIAGCPSHADCNQIPF